MFIQQRILHSAILIITTRLLTFAPEIHRYLDETPQPISYEGGDIDLEAMFDYHETIKLQSIDFHTVSPLLLKEVKDFMSQPAALN